VNLTEMNHTLVFVMLLGSTAYAQPAPDASDPVRAPGFVMLDRLDANPRAGAELSYVLPENNSAGTAVRVDLHGHYVDRATGLGAYASVPMSYLSGASEEYFELAGIEVGGLFAKRVAPEVGIVVRGGVVLPTAGDDFGAMIQNGVAGYARPTDIAQAYGRTALRVSGSPTLRRGQLFGRIDVGLDYFAAPDDNDTDAILRVGPGIGFDGGKFAVMGELLVFRTVGGSVDEIVSVGALSARFTAGRVTPCAAIVVPFDERPRKFVSGAITFGVEAAL
jgi:hypothetical protein